MKATTSISFKIIIIVSDLTVNNGTSKILEITVGITAALVAAIIVGIIFYRKKQKEEERYACF